jgi:hypothetical protein
MATLVFNAAATALTKNVGSEFARALIVGAATAAGSFIDQQYLFPGQAGQQGPRLSDVPQVTGAEGASMYKVWGRYRVPGTLIWATDYLETSSTEEVGGKGTGASSAQTTTYSYSASFAVGLCEGEITGIGRIWLDNEVWDTSGITYRVYNGSSTQGRDPKIQAVEGVDFTPAYRNTAYIVFEDVDLTEFGNRIPAIEVEVFRYADADAGNRVEELIKSVTLIPASGEFAYATENVWSESFGGNTSSETVQNAKGQPNILTSFDALEDTCENMENVAVVVAWHGTDLRCGSCEIKPRVEDNNVTDLGGKINRPWSWKVGNNGRESYSEVSQIDGRPALGGVIADRAVYQSLVEVAERGWTATFYPFILMDIPGGNALTDPYGGAEQAAYPWRGRITVTPAIGRPSTADKTAGAAAQIASFFGTCTSGHFGWNSADYTVTYSGPSEWGFRRHILHYARLCKAVNDAHPGTVESFIIGSEMIGITSVRDNTNAFPGVTQLISLLGEVRTILGASVKLGYAADWSEYHSYRPSDGTSDVYFHLDPLWSNSNCDFIGIDNYLPLSDWRDGYGHLDAASFSSVYDLDYLKDNIEGGEFYDWYYASTADRNSQTRTNIADATYSKPWVFRNKDIKNWWLNAHYNRPAGSQSGSPTAWTAQSKPIRFTEFGCPAIDKGTNQPNVFYDPKSSESFFPYFSNGGRDDYMQRSYLRAMYEYWNDAANNPTSTVYSLPMINMARSSVWTWDSRPWPDFPARTTIWSDGSNWRLGHWITGRLGATSLQSVVHDIVAELLDPSLFDTTELFGTVQGYARDQIMSPRDLLAPLSLVYQFDAYESEGKIKFKHRGTQPVATIGESGMITFENDGPIAAIRTQETELPHFGIIDFIDSGYDYRATSVQSRRLRGNSARTITSRIGLVADPAWMSSVTDALLIEAWVQRVKTDFVLPPSALRIDPTDVITVTINGTSYDVRIEQIGYEFIRPVAGVRTDASIYRLIQGEETGNNIPPLATPAGVDFVFLDLPLINALDASAAHAPMMAALGVPWPGSVSLYRSTDDTNYTLDQAVPSSALYGLLVADLYESKFPGATWDEANDIWVQLHRSYTLSSKTEQEVLNGANLCAIQNADGDWELIQFQNAELQSGNQWKLSRLLRGQFGTEHAMRAPVAENAPWVLIDANVVRSTLPLGLRNILHQWKYGPSTKPITDTTYVKETFTPAAVGLKPYAPVHLAAHWDTAYLGDITLEWIRRTRYGGDSWEGVEVPLNEESELYDLEIYNGVGTTLLRTVTGLTSPTYTYTEAMQIADYGFETNYLQFKVYQISQAYGRGESASHADYVKFRI